MTPGQESDPSGLDDDTYRLLVEIGMLGAGLALPESESLMRALAALKPGASATWIGRALLHLNRGEADGAAALLSSDGIQSCPDAPEIRVFLALALMQGQRPVESRRWLSSADLSTADAPLLNLARQIEEALPLLQRAAMLAEPPAGK